MASRPRVCGAKGKVGAKGGGVCSVRCSCWRWAVSGAEDDAECERVCEMVDATERDWMLGLRCGTGEGGGYSVRSEYCTASE